MAEEHGAEVPVSSRAAFLPEKRDTQNTGCSSSHLQAAGPLGGANGSLLLVGPFIQTW